MNNSKTFGSVTLIHGDCMDFMADLKDNEFNLSVCDPPYGIKPKHKFGVKETIRFNIEDVKWDVLPEKKYFTELKRISKNQIIWGGNYFIDYLYATRCFLIWDKENGSNPFADCEMAWTSFDNSARIFRYFWLGSHIHKLETVIHPTQKPVALYEWILKNYANPNDTIFDSHAGSFSSAVACLKMGFTGTFIEIDEDYFKAGCERVEAVYEAMTLGYAKTKLNKISPTLF